MSTSNSKSSTVKLAPISSPAPGLDRVGAGGALMSAAGSGGATPPAADRGGPPRLVCLLASHVSSRERLERLQDVLDSIAGQEPLSGVHRSVGAVEVSGTP